MKRVLLLGAGMVAPPLVRYLIDHDIWLTIACNNPERAAALLNGYGRGAVRPWAVGENEALDEMIAHVDLVVSLLPAPMHPVVAQLCVKRHKHLVTTSYVSPDMRAFDEAARKAGIVLLNELGVDPGLDHLSAMQIIDEVRAAGETVIGFRSYCGGLPAPQSNNNPWGYKFSWSPAGVLRAATKSARYLQDGQVRVIAAQDMMQEVTPLMVSDLPALEAYPNRDALDYVDVYGLQQAKTMYRGTLRYPGWTQTMRVLEQLGALSDLGPDALSWAEWMKKHAAQITVPDAVEQRLQWLGLYSTHPINVHAPTILEALSELMLHKMAYEAHEVDMLVMVHQFLISNGTRQYERTSQLVVYGDPDGDSAMAKTVALPAAIGTRLILEGKFARSGVHIPIYKELYEPILDELREHHIQFVDHVDN